MAAPKPTTLYTSSRGLNTRLDPQRLMHGTKDDPGAVEFAQAVNVDIDDRGLVTIRKGSSLLQAGAFHSLFRARGGDCFVVQDRTSDAAIFKVDPSTYTLTGIRSGLAKGSRVCLPRPTTAPFMPTAHRTGLSRAAFRSTGR